MKTANRLNFYDAGDVEIVSGVSSHNFPVHIHQSFCIGLVTKGKINLKYKNIIYVLKQASVYFINPLTPHSILSINNKEYSYITFCLKKSFLAKYNFFTYPCFVSKKEYYKQLIDIYSSFIENKNGSQLIKNINDFMQSMVLSFKNRPGNLKDYVLRAKLFIDNNPDWHFNIQELSDKIHITKFHLIRQFKLGLGISPHGYYVYKKIALIKQRLLKRQAVSDLAAELDFSDQSHLNNTFKKYVGITPLQFCKSYRSAGENLAKI